MYAEHALTMSSGTELDEYMPTPKHQFGCTIRTYNKVTGHHSEGWSPECLSFVEIEDQNFQQMDILRAGHQNV